MTTKSKTSTTSKKAAVKTGTAAKAEGTAVKAGSGEKEKPQPLSPAAQQLKVFDQAMQLFAKRKFAEAAAEFAVVMKGPAVHVSDKARSYSQICERQANKNRVELHTAEDHFNYGVARLNSGDVAQAKIHLNRAHGLEPNGDHILYALALCCGLSGDGEGACENLKRAIELEPQNRVLARQDAEFTALAGQIPGLRPLLGLNGR